MATSFFRRPPAPGPPLERCLIGLFNGDVLAAEHHGFSCAPGAGQKLQPPTGKFRSSRRFLISCPTAPVAPKMATVYFFIAIHILSLPKGKIVLIDCSVVVGSQKRQPASISRCNASLASSSERLAPLGLQGRASRLSSHFPHAGQLVEAITAAASCQNAVGSCARAHSACQLPHSDRGNVQKIHLRPAGLPGPAKSFFFCLPYLHLCPFVFHILYDGTG